VDDELRQPSELAGLADAALDAAAADFGLGLNKLRIFGDMN
jgi:hypothetical protein